MRPLIFALLLLAGLAADADECAWSAGGYCVSLLVQETTKVIEATTDIKPATLKEPDNFSSGTACYQSYEAIWTELIRAGLTTEEEKKRAFDEAAQAGGVKIGGMNLVVLGARTLQTLVDLKKITLEQAQAILNHSKKEKP